MKDFTNVQLQKSSLVSANLYGNWWDVEKLDERFLEYPC